jgi:serine/threonine protein kinase
MDVWAIGIMTYCILFNRLPFTGTTREIIKNLISSSELVTPKEITVTP